MSDYKIFYERFYELSPQEYAGKWSRTAIWCCPEGKELFWPGDLRMVADFEKKYGSRQAEGDIHNA